MPFVKLDTGILDSSLWIEKDQRDVFITALLMAEPYEFKTPQDQVEVDRIELTGFTAPPGWYGFVEAAGVGIINRSGLDRSVGLEALRKLGSPEDESRTKDFGGRRMIRIDGGYLILNYMKFRDRDYGARDRMRRLRERRREQEGPVTANVTLETPNVREPLRENRGVTGNVTQADSREQIAESREQRETSAKTRRQAAPLDLTLPDWVSKSSWDAFTEIRKNKRNPIRTQRQFDLLIKELAGLRVQGFDPTEMIDLAVMRGWQSFYAPKGENHNGNGKSRTDLAAESLIRESEQKSRDH